MCKVPPLPEGMEAWYCEGVNEVCDQMSFAPPALFCVSRTIMICVQLHREHPHENCMKNLVIENFCTQ